MKTWDEINEKKYGKLAFSMIAEAGLKGQDFAKEAYPPSFRIVHLPTQDFFVFGGEDGGAKWTRPGYPGRQSQTGRGPAQSWETKIQYFEAWLGELRDLINAIEEHTGDEQLIPSARVIPQPAASDSPSTPQEVRQETEQVSSQIPSVVVLSNQVTIVRNAGTAEESRLVVRYDGDMVRKILLFSVDRPNTGDEIHSEFFDEPRIITHVDPIFAYTSVVYWDVSITPKSEWIRRQRLDRMPVADQHDDRNALEVTSPAPRMGSKDEPLNQAPLVEANSATAHEDVDRTGTGNAGEKRPDFTSETGRNIAISLYVERWSCSEAALARTARVDPADLSKWKKTRLTPKSDKSTRIETVLIENQPPTLLAARPDY